MELEWTKLTEEQKAECYKSYIADIISEWGDHAKYLTYEEWCKESEKIGEALI